MPQIIESGYLYIAQPPLYKVSHGKSSSYLKDEDSMEQYLIDEGARDAVLTLHSGEQIAGEDLLLLIDHAKICQKLVVILSDKYDHNLVEQTAIAGALNPEVLSDSDRAMQAAGYVANRLDQLSPEIERGWSGKPTKDGGLSFTRTVRGVTETHSIDGPLIRSQDARRLDEQAGKLQQTYLKRAILKRKDVEQIVRSPSQLLDAIFSFGRKGFSLQRYKGLGEMNPDQLWETTLDPSIRSLLQVTTSQADEADDLFNTLMGEKVEPRRDFIQNNALKVVNLDT